MSDTGGLPNSDRSLVLRLSVPAQGGLRSVVPELAARVAEYLGSHQLDPAAAGPTLEGLAARVAPSDSDGEIVFEFCEVEGELLIRARCNDRSSELRYPLPA